MKSSPSSSASFLLACTLLGLIHAAPAETNFPGKTWTTKAPADAHMEAAKLDSFRDFVGGRGCVVRHGYLIYSWGDVSRRADVASACKPMLAHFLFKAVEEERIGGVDEKIVRFEPRLGDLNPNLSFKDRHMSWRHLANQISCYGVTEAPGTAFDYNDFNFALFFDTLFLKAYGSRWDKVDADILKPKLTGPLQCEDDPTLMAFGTGNQPGRLAISVRDFCRFGLLYLHRGNWNGQRLLSATNAMLAVTTPLPNSIPRTAGGDAAMIPGQRSGGGGKNQCDHLGSYSFMWWLNGMDREGKRHWPDAPPDTYGAFGHGGPRAMVVIPSLDLVMAWNDANIRSRDAENEALKRLVAACRFDVRGSVAVTSVRIEPGLWRIGHGDNWHVTWADDDHQYTVLGDGGGLSPTGPVWNTRVYRLTGQPPSHTLELLPQYPPASYALQHWYGYGLIAIDKRFYHFLCYLEHGQWHGVGTAPEHFRGARIVQAPDPDTWQFADGTPLDFKTPPPAKMLFWDEPDRTFSLLSVLQFGRDYADNTDGFVYVYAPNGYTEGTMNQLVLARVPKDQILNRAAYRFFVRREAGGSAIWSKDVAQRGVVHRFPDGWVGRHLAYSWHPSVVYVKPLNQFLMVAAGTGRGGSRTLSQPSCLGLYTASAPWGPWKEIHWNPNWIVDSQDDRLYEPVIAPKWIARDGSSFYLVHSNSRGNFADQYYRMNLQKMALCWLPTRTP